MNFVILMAAGVLERRGGLLIHGAIIAREHRLPYVTGVKKMHRVKSRRGTPLPQTDFSASWLLAREEVLLMRQSSSFHQNS